MRNILITLLFSPLLAFAGANTVVYNVTHDTVLDGSLGEQEVSIAKNYLNEDEMKLLGLLVEQYLAFAETMAQQQTPMYMNDWIARLDSLLQLNGREILTHAGTISHQMALDKSGEEFQKYKNTQSQLEQEQSLKEIEADIKKLKP